MLEQVRTFTLGKAQVSIINLGDIRASLAEHMNISEDELNSNDFLKDFAAQQQMPMHNVLVQLPEANVLLDAGSYDYVDDNSVYKINGYMPPPPLVERITDLGVPPEFVDHVIVTHRHWDHFNATTVNLNGEYVPQFPNATYYVGAKDWERASEQMPDNPDMLEHHTLAVLHQLGKLKLVDAPLDLGIGIEILPAPGETVGHQIVRIHSEGQTLYYLGDLYHHPVEFYNSEWLVGWANPDLTRSSRQMLIPKVIEDDALLLATHIPDLGRLQQEGAQHIWTSVTPRFL